MLGSDTGKVKERFKSSNAATRSRPRGADSDQQRNDDLSVAECDLSKFEDLMQQIENYNFSSEQNSSLGKSFYNTKESVPPTGGSKVKIFARSYLYGPLGRAKVVKTIQKKPSGSASPDSAGYLLQNATLARKKQLEKILKDDVEGAGQRRNHPEKSNAQRSVKSLAETPALKSSAYQIRVGKSRQNQSTTFNEICPKRRTHGQPLQQKSFTGGIKVSRISRE